MQPGKQTGGPSHYACSRTATSLVCCLLPASFQLFAELDGYMLGYTDINLIKAPAATLCPKLWLCLATPPS